ncbi:MAG: hypothetical protein ACPGDB_01475, partial [Fusobacterium sp.]
PENYNSIMELFEILSNNKIEKIEILSFKYNKYNNNNSKNNIDIDAENILNKATGAIVAGKYFDTDGNLVQGTTGDRNVNLDADREIINEGNIEALNNINTTGPKITNEQTGFIYSHNDTNMNNTDIINRGNVSSSNDTNIKSANLINESTGRINSSRNTDITSTNINNAGELIAANDVLIKTTGTTNNSGEILANRNVEINRTKELGQMTNAEKTGTTNLTNTGTINASAKVLIAANEVNNVGGKIHSGTDIEIDTNKINNTTGELVTNGNLKIDMTNTDNINHGNDMNVVGKVYGNQLISIKNFNNIINEQIDLMSNGDIYLESTQKDIINRKKIVAGQDLTIKAETGKVTNKSATGEAILQAGQDLTIDTITYDNDRSSKIIGGTGTGNINVDTALDNQGRIYATDGTMNININDGNSSFTNSNQVAVGGALNIKASTITNKAHKLIYSKRAMTLDAMVGNIVNEAGAEILTTLGDMNLNANKGNVYNKATNIYGARIKSGGNMTITAINFYNEAVQSRYQDPQNLPNIIKTGSAAQIVAYLTQTDPLTKGKNLWKTLETNGYLKIFLQMYIMIKFLQLLQN